jgi:hypothetical protein
MEIKTKLEPKDEIFFIHENIVRKSNVREVHTKTTKNGYDVSTHKISYEVEYNAGAYIKEEDCGGTIEELFDILKDTVNSK